MEKRLFLLKICVILISIGNCSAFVSRHVRDTLEVFQSENFLDRVKRDENGNNNGGFNLDASKSFPGVGTLKVAGDSQNGIKYSFTRDESGTRPFQAARNSLQQVGQSLTGMFRDVGAAATRTINTSAKTVNNGLQQWINLMQSFGQAMTNMIQPQQQRQQG